MQILLPISGWKCCLCQHGQTPPPQTGNLAMAMAAMQKAQEKEIPLETSKNFTEQYWNVVKWNEHQSNVVKQKFVNESFVEKTAHSIPSIFNINIF